MKVTRIAYSKGLTASKFSRLTEIAQRLGALRNSIWQEYGSLKGLGTTSREIRDLWLEEKKFDVPNRLWKATLRDVLADIAAYREAAKAKVRRAVYLRTKDKKERKRLYKLLRSDIWTDEPFLCRQMRKHFRHGHTGVGNQIILDAGSYNTFVQGGKAWVAAQSLETRQRVAIPLNTTHAPTGTLRLILRDNKVEIHYAIEAHKACSTRSCGTGTLGVDKGYTEVLTDSKGTRHGLGLGSILSTESDVLKVKYQRRNKLNAIASSKPHKTRKIRANNLGRKKLDARKARHTENVRNKVYKAVHGVVDDAQQIVSEDLSAVIRSRTRRSKNMKRRLSGWVKGTIATALTNVSQRRGASLVLVNASYTSQTDSRHGVLLGRRRGDLFHCFDGVVLDADENAALNILARNQDPEIDLWTPFKKVRSILLERTKQFQRLGLLNQDSSCPA